MATRVSRKDAVTWWHLDDGGEHVFQVGLPLNNKKNDDNVVIGPNGRKVAKIFIFAPRW